MPYPCVAPLLRPPHSAMLKLLVFAHTPPPLHGQSVMVATLLEGLHADPDIEVLHVNARVSRDAADVGRWRIGKIFALLGSCFAAWKLRAHHGRIAFYYVPAPGKRSALYRDFIVMLLCRPFFSALVLHWHAAGLGGWLDSDATPPERWLARRLLGGADLAIVLGENLRADAARLAPQRIAVVRNGIADPCPGFTRPARAPDRPIEAVFLGLCTREKGLFDAIAGVRDANARSTAGASPYRLSVAGDFSDAGSAREFATAAKNMKDSVRHIGFVSGQAKDDLLARADVLVFPTAYPHETQGLVIAEALAYDLPVIVTRWRAVHEGLPASHVYFVEPHRPDQIADALIAMRASATPAGAQRRHYLAHFTSARHVAALKSALLSLPP